ncbi:hypothetical protein ROHU_005189 [Labeo rohita]|uniref:Uncharacterized protein n=1 Tax=Labeo rohita TaxID=84645 RepID=A0A498NFA4_LABRO|nr:hypothetical protein ROHU_005189 [Labeo rohita]
MHKVLAAPTRPVTVIMCMALDPARPCAHATRHVTATCARYWQLPLDMSLLHVHGTGSCHSTCHCYYVHGTGPGMAMCACHSTCHRYMRKVLAAPTRHVTATCAWHWQLSLDLSLLLCAWHWTRHGHVRMPLDMSPLHAQGTGSSHSTCHCYMCMALAAATRPVTVIMCMALDLAWPCAHATQHVTATCARYWQLPLDMSPLHAQGTGSSHSTSPLHAQGTGSSHSTCHRYMRKVLAAPTRRHRYMRKVLAAPTRRHRYMRKVLAAPTRHVTATCAWHWQLPLDLSLLLCAWHWTRHGHVCMPLNMSPLHAQGTGSSHSTCHRYMRKVLGRSTRYVTAPVQGTGRSPLNLVTAYMRR